MAVSGSIAFAALAGAAVGKATSKPPTLPNPAESAPKVDEAAMAKAAEGAAAQQRKRAASASAQGSTILTGPNGLGELPKEQQGSKNLLGY